MADGKRKIALKQTDALVVVDLQNDFCPGGALPVPGGDRIVPYVNSLIRAFWSKGGLVVEIKEWHSENHCSFKEFGGFWPRHCARETKGADFHPALLPTDSCFIFYKGYDASRESYSGFEAVSFDKIWGSRVFMQKGQIGRKGRGMNPPYTLEEILSASGGCGNVLNRRIFVVGLATDYCVKATVLDGIKLGFKVYVVTDAVAAVNVSPDDGEKALREMVAVGAKLCESKDIKEVVN